MLPNDMPPWSTVYSHYRKWNLTGVWEKVLESLNRKTRKKKGKKAEPTFAIIDSRSFKTQYASEESRKEWRPQGDPEKVNVHDFVDKELGRANPYGIYDLANNTGWVSVGTDHDTASFAVATIRRWWFAMRIVAVTG